MTNGWGLGARRLLRRACARACDAPGDV